MSDWELESEPVSEKVITEAAWGFELLGVELGGSALRLDLFELC